MLILVFTPRASAEIPLQIGPVPALRIEGNTMRNAQSGTVIAECEDRHWVFDGQKFYRADCAGPVMVNLEGCEAAPKRFGPFKHFSLSDGTAYVDRAVFAQLNSSDKWYVERLGAECPSLFLVPSDGGASQTATTGAGAALKVATYNVNGVNGRLPRLLEWLDEASPDIVCLQEIKTSDEKCPVRALEHAGYGSLWHGQRSHHGVAILAKGEQPTEVRRGLPGDDLDRQARYLEAQVKGLVVASVYLPNGNPQPGPKFDFKLAWFERFNAHARTLMDSGKPVVLAGDLNVVPTKADIYNEWLWRLDAVVQPETRAAFGRLLEQGWIDATRYLHPEERIYTFWVNHAAFRRNAGFRMDFLMLTPNLAPRLAATGVDSAHRGREKPSDHAPVWVQFS